MKRLFLKACLVLFLSLMLVSCSSLSSLVRAQVEGLPSWIYSPQQRSGEVAFVGKGTAPVNYNARLLAYESILGQISAYVGEDVYDMYYRELTTTNAIADFNLTIASEYTVTEGRAGFDVYLLARMDEALLSGRRTSVYNQMIEREQAIEAILEKADQAYRSNDDTGAIKQYLEAAMLSAEGPVSERKFETETLVDKAISFIESLRFSLRNQVEEEAKVTVYLRRKSRLLSPKVLNASINATFQARNSLSETYSDFLQFNTASDGYFLFIPYNQGLVKDGQIVFSLDLASTIAQLEKTLPAELVANIREAVSAISITFPYTLTSTVSGKSILSEIQEFSQEGSLGRGTQALQVFNQELSLDDIMVEEIDLKQADIEDQLSALQGEADLAFLGSVGVVSEQQVGDRSVVVASGNVGLYDLTDGSLLFDTLSVEAVGSGESREEAQRVAFSRFGSIAAYLQSAWLFKR
ncbi:hypothetical protein [uncultured Sphaerochaeta sp.]|uniref:hypothetical protein n=1 Tax=uncultured Sphaerochaeta sp. TaxID=886478 RepID=UPI002A0A28B1|nr:hypothetical protein [uncultured Sphaerochaeta sp.]